MKKQLTKQSNNNLDLTFREETIEKFTTEPYPVKINKWSIHTKMRFKTKKGYVLIPVPNIIYCKADGCYTQIFIAEEQPIYVCHPIRNLELILKNFNILRCHRSYLVNLDFVKEIISKSKTINLIGNATAIPCSREQYSTIFTAIKTAIININSYS